LTGNWLLAWQANSMVLIAAALVAIRSLGWLVEIWRQPQAEPGRRWLPAAWSRQWLGIVIVIATVYAVIRNF
jgi:hypothetical protein